MSTWTLTSLDGGKAVATYKVDSREEAAELLRAAMYGNDVEQVRARQLARGGEADRAAKLAA